MLNWGLFGMLSGGFYRTEYCICTVLMSNPKSKSVSPKKIMTSETHGRFLFFLGLSRYILSALQRWVSQRFLSAFVFWRSRRRQEVDESAGWTNTFNWSYDVILIFLDSVLSIRPRDCSDHFDDSRCFVSYPPRTSPSPTTFIHSEWFAIGFGNMISLSKP